MGAGVRAWLIHAIGVVGVVWLVFAMFILALTVVFFFSVRRSKRPAEMAIPMALVLIALSLVTGWLLEMSMGFIVASSVCLAAYAFGQAWTLELIQRHAERRAR
jgi:O-antigen/teichoic acid export membrane protein